MKYHLPLCVCVFLWYGRGIADLDKFVHLAGLSLRPEALPDPTTLIELEVCHVSETHLEFLTLYSSLLVICCSFIMLPCKEN